MRMQDRRRDTHEADGKMRVWVVVWLGTIALAALGSLTVLIFKDKKVDAAVIVSYGQVISAACGALGALLVGAQGKTGPQDTHIVNPPSDPVPIAPQEPHADDG